MTKKKTKKKVSKKKTKTKAKKKPTEISFAVYMRNNGDGSGSPCFFPDEEAAEAYAGEDDERYCEDISTFTLMVDEKGNLVQPPKTKIRDDGVLIEDYKIGKYHYNDPTDWSC
jgi:hypothetical protein